MGTRFVTAKESIVHENYKQKVIKAKDIDSEVTGMSTGHPIRVLRNKMTRQYLKLEKEGAPFEELEKMTLGALRKAVVDGDTVYGSVMAGQSTSCTQSWIWAATPAPAAPAWPSGTRKTPPGINQKLTPG